MSIDAHSHFGIVKEYQLVLGGHFWLYGAILFRIARRRVLIYFAKKTRTADTREAWFVLHFPFSSHIRIALLLLQGGFYRFAPLRRAIFSSCRFFLTNFWLFS